MVSNSYNAVLFVVLDTCVDGCCLLVSHVAHVL